MSDNQDRMYPDENHVQRWGDDAVLYRPEDENGFRESAPGLPGATRRAVGWGLGIGLVICAGIALAIIVIFASGCSVAKPVCTLDSHGIVANQPCQVTAETVAAKERFNEKVKAEQLRLLKEQHKDFDKTLREYRMP